MAGTTTCAHAYGFSKDARYKFICATRTGQRDAKLVLPVELTPGITSTEKELKLLISRRRFRPGEVYETVEGEFDLVTEFVGAPDDTIKGFANLYEVLR